MIRSILHFLFPTKCLICGRDGSAICATCERKVSVHLTQPGNDTLAFFEFHNPVVKKIIHALKYEGNRSLASYLGTALYREFFKKAATSPVVNTATHQRDPLVLIPLPLSKKSKRARGYNQTQLIAEAIRDAAQKDQIPITLIPNLLEKTRHTPRQVELRLRSERLENLKGAFSVKNGDRIHGCVVVLLDDVTTTGATFAEARRALAPFHPKRIIAVAVAH